VLASFGVATVLLLLGGKYPRAALVACFSAFVLTFLGNALFATDNIQFSFLIFNISPESLADGLRLGIRISGMILVAIAFIAVTPLYELLEAFRGLRIPAAAEMYLTIVLRYVDILWYDIQVSMKAMAVRGTNWEGGIRDKIPAFSRLMLPLIFRILDHVDGQSLAIDNRGGVNTRRETVDVNPAAPAVSMENVFVRYDAASSPQDKHALTGLNFKVKQGEATVLLGRIGAGKTSTLLLCTGLIPYSVGRMKGEVALFGHNTKSTALSKLGRLARIVFPSAVQGLVGLTVKDELMFSLRTQAIEPEDTRTAMVKALEIVGLDDSFLPRLTLGLSGGEMQRVALASAIVAQPRLLALDDVTVQLDPVGKQEVIAALHALLEGRMTTVMCDPHVELLAEIGDRFISLEEGQVLGDREHLDAGTLERASLRVPQLLRLGQKLGLDLPAGVSAALAALQPLANGRPASFPATAAGQEIIVSARDLIYTYPNGPTAIKDLSVTFRRGEFAAILGSNGSGKTTMALMLAGALTPTAGEILIQGDPFNREQHRGYIGYVFQEPVNQIVTMKVVDELAFGPLQLGWDEAAVEQVVRRELKRYDLAPEAVPLHLSPAEARKLAIAATLTMNPSLIILDEPTNNLDETETQHLMAHLKELQAEGTAVVVITHDVEVACRYADRVVVMAGGDILLDGPTRQVMAQPELLAQSDVVPPPVVMTALALWPDIPPALTVDELAASLSTHPVRP